MIRSEVSKRNKYYICKNRYYELKYHCLQYGDWKHAYNIIFQMYDVGKDTSKFATDLVFYKTKIETLEKAVMDAEPSLYNYILKGVTQGVSYDHLKTKYDIPCGREMYYDRYRKFFYILDKLL